MLNRATVAMVGLAALVTATGCAGRTSPTPSASVSAPANVAGMWTGTVGVSGAPVTMMLTQSGDAVKGDLRVGGRTDISGPIEGNVEGNTIKLRGEQGSAPLLTVQGERMTGIVRGATLDLRRSN